MSNAPQDPASDESAGLDVEPVPARRSGEGAASALEEMITRSERKQRNRPADDPPPSGE